MKTRKPDNMKQSYKLLAQAVTVLALLITLLGCYRNTDAGFKNFSSKASVLAFTPTHETTRWSLPNGLTILFQEDPEIPIVSGELLVKGGSLWDAPSSRGAIAMMGAMLRQGGAGAYSADALDLELEKLSAGISSSFGTESGEIGFTCLKPDLEHVFSIFADIVLRPRFEESRLLLQKEQNLEGIKRRIDDPSTVAGLTLRTRIYGDSAYGVVLESSDIGKLNQKEIRDAYNHIIRPDGALLVISGHSSRTEIEPLVRRYFSDWTPRGSMLPPPPPVPEEKAASITFIEQPLSQATVFVGELGVPRLTPDYLGIDAFNSLFGSGGFGALLTRRIRTELGLAYSVFGAIVPGPVRGKNLLVLQTKSDSVGPALAESLSILTDIQANGISKSLLDETKRGINKSFVFNFESKWQTLSREAHFELLGYPADYDATYIPGMLALTPEDIQTVAQRRWNLNYLAVVVVGNRKALDSLLAKKSTLPNALAKANIVIGSFDEKFRASSVSQ